MAGKTQILIRSRGLAFFVAVSSLNVCAATPERIHGSLQMDGEFTLGNNTPGYGVCVVASCSHSSEGLSGGGGTSASTRFFAGIVALLNQKLGTRAGNINSELYTLASFSPDIFHDVTEGTNEVPCQPGSKDCSAAEIEGYSAGPGYDLITGLGSVDAYNLLEEWGADFSLAVLSGSVQLARGTTSTDDITVTPVNNFRGTVTFSCTVPAELQGVSCLVGGSISGGSGTNNVTISRSNTSFLPAGRRVNLDGPGGVFFAGVVLLLVLVVCNWNGQRFLAPERRSRIALSLIVALVTLTMAACDDGTEVTSTMTAGPVTGNVVITATSGNLSHTAEIAVTLE